MTTKTDLLPVFCATDGRGNRCWFSPSTIEHALLQGRPNLSSRVMAAAAVKLLLAEREALLDLLFEIRSDLRTVTIDVHAPRRVNTKINKLLKKLKDSYAIPDPDQDPA